MPGGPDPFAEGPDDPERDDEMAMGGTDDGAPAGWVPPADRTWRHPSELGSAGGGRSPSFGALAGPAAAVPPWPRSYSPHHRVATVCVAAVAIMAVTVGSLLLVKTGEGPGTPRSTLQAAVAGSVTSSASCCTITDAVIHRAAPSVVSLSHETAPTATIGCGVVVAGAGLVATTADAVRDHRTLRVTTATGRRLRATVVAVDAGSDVALLSVPAMLEPARFADDTDVGPGFPSAVLVPGAAVHDHADARWSSATVRSVGTAVPQGDGAGMAAIMVAGPSGPALTGQPLVDAEGDVIGLLDRSATATASGRLRAYLPAPLVVGVARQLAMTGKVRHGWLGLEGEDATPSATGSTAGAGATVPASTGPNATVPTATGSARRSAVTQGDAGTITTTTATATGPAGAEVVGVEPGGPSARELRPGDVIVALDGRPVRSLAELRARLYVLPPGSRATVGAVRGGQTLTETVRLAATP
jgi:S1-C subfamily serine protease